ncbi:MAG: CvfB family protein [Flammeovirgaceae bacterium]
MSTLKVGDYNNLKVNRSSDFGLYLSYDEGEVLLPNRYISDELKEGSEVEVFVYHDSEGRLVAVREQPFAKVGDFAALKVKDVTDIGAFLDIGLAKDLFVPLKEQHRRMQEGKTYLVKVMLDPRTGRMIGVSKIGAFLEKENIDLEEGQEVDLMVYELTDLGFMCLVNETYAGMLYRNEVFSKLEIGSKLTGYVKKLREDNKIDLSERPLGFKGLEGQEASIVDRLKKSPKGFLPFNDRSSPEEIRSEFEMSKKSFKKLIGILYKQRIIEIDQKGIKLVE